MDFETELLRVLPGDVPHRDRLIEKASRHLRLILAANEFMNLTRITSPQEAAIKHVFDSIAPWSFFAGAKRIIDAGTGAGFPGVPLSVVFPETRFSLLESVQKKARFVDSAVDELDLHNVHVFCDRAERHVHARPPDIITARAVAPLTRLVPLFAKSLRSGTRLLLYKGPDVDQEFEEAHSLLQRHRAVAHVVHRYRLPDDLGARTLVEVRSQDLKRAAS